MMIAVILGIPLAVGQSNGGPVIKAVCTVYIEFFRGTPVLVQLLFLYFGLPVIGITLPGWLTAIVGLGLNMPPMNRRYTGLPSRPYLNGSGRSPTPLECARSSPSGASFSPRHSALPCLR